MSLLQNQKQKKEIITKDISEKEEIEEKERRNKKKEESSSKDAPITRTELRNVLKAMDKEGFSTIMDEYIKEISDPNNVKEQNAFLLQSEKSKDLPSNVVLTQPKKGFCIKTIKKTGKGSNKTKIYINLCMIEEINEPEEDKTTSTWSLPYLVNKPRNDMDSKQKYCQTFDVVFHPKAFGLSGKYAEFKKFMCDNAVNGINNHILKANKEEASMDYSVVSKYDYKGEEVAYMNIYGLVSKSKFSDKVEEMTEYKTSLMKEVEERKNIDSHVPVESQFDQIDIQVDLSNKNISNDYQAFNDKCVELPYKSVDYKIKYSNDFQLNSLFYTPGNMKIDKEKTKVIIDIHLKYLPETISISQCMLEVMKSTIKFKANDIYDFVIHLKFQLDEERIEAKWNKELKILSLIGEIVHKERDYDIERKNSFGCEVEEKEEEDEKKNDVKEDLKREEKDNDYIDSINEVKEETKTDEKELLTESIKENNLNLNLNKTEIDKEEDKTEKKHHVEDIIKTVETKNETEEKSESKEELKIENKEDIEKNEDIDDDVQREVKEGNKSKRVYHIICFNNEKIYDIE